MTTAEQDQRPLFGLRPGDRAMVIAPHPDDETIGPGGTIARLAAEGVEVHVLCVTVRAAKMWGGASEPTVRYAEFDKACAALGVTRSTIAWVDETGELDISTRQRALVDLIERNEEVSLATVRPQALLIPSSGGFHQDHQAVHRAAFAAARVQPEGLKPTPRLVLGYRGWRTAGPPRTSRGGCTSTRAGSGPPRKRPCGPTGRRCAPEALGPSNRST